MSQVIVVDDDRTNTQLIQMLLEMDGYSVTICPTIESAQKHASADINAFIIDCYLAAGADGTDLANAIRAGETAARPDAFIILTSGDDRRREDAQRVNADLFLLKPYAPSRLSDALKAGLGE